MYRHYLRWGHASKSSYSTSLEIATKQWDKMMMTMASGINLWELEP